MSSIMYNDVSVDLSKIEVAPIPEVQEEDGNRKIKIRMQLIQLNTDPITFKPYSPQFKPPADQPLQVQVEILQRYVKELKNDGTIVLTPLGLARIAKIIATALVKIHSTEE